MSSIKKAIKALYGSKLGKILPVLLIAGMVATASASVFVMYYGTATATAGDNDLSLVAGGDNTVSCGTTFPCITITPSSLGDTASVAINLGKATTSSPQPASYFTDALEVSNANVGASHDITAVTVSGITRTAAADFGSITVYYCTTQNDDPATNCNALFAITSTTGGSMSNMPKTIAASGTGYFEFVGYFGSGASNSDTIAFNLQIKWV